MIYDRIREMLLMAEGSGRLFPATLFYNEGWLLRLTLDWFSRQAPARHPLGFSDKARWFSEALLPSQFYAQSRVDKLAEGWTHADGVIGHVAIGDSALADTKLLEGGLQLVVTEAKMFSPLSAGVTNASYFDQAARNVACMAEILYRAKRRPASMESLGFIVLAPQEQINARIFSSLLSPDSIKSKVNRRVSEYQSPEREKKSAWLLEWFAPMLERITIQALSWETILDHISSRDRSFGAALGEFYSRSLTFNRAQEPERPRAD